MRRFSTKQSPFTPYYGPIGSVMMSFNYLESQLRHAIWLLARTPSLTEIEVILSHIQSFEARIALFTQLANYRFKDKRSKKKIASLAASLRDTNSRRNDLIHGDWKAVGNPAFITKYQRGKPNISWRQIEATPALVRSDSMRTWRLALAVRKFCPAIANLNARDSKARKRE